jgi:hypothetical protein
VKTFFPQNREDTYQFRANKIIYLVRHPIDVMPSYAGLVFTMSHSLEPARDWKEYNCWHPFLNKIVPQWQQYHNYMLAQSKKTPTFFLSYELLMTKPEETLTDLFCFLLDQESLEGTLL